MIFRFRLTSLLSISRDKPETIFGRKTALATLGALSLVRLRGEASLYAERLFCERAERSLTFYFRASRF